MIPVVTLIIARTFSLGSEANRVPSGKKAKSETVAKSLRTRVDVKAPVEGSTVWMLPSIFPPRDAQSVPDGSNASVVV
jgi:hypothetical protein